MMTLNAKASESAEIAVKTGESKVNVMLTPEKYRPIPAIIPIHWNKRVRDFLRFLNRK